jgi:hypothetical protein
LKLSDEPLVLCYPAVPGSEYPGQKPLDHANPSFVGRACFGLYKWAYKLDPYTPSSLVADCFELALDIRSLDMRASPYDLAPLGYAPVRIETVEGRAQYRREQAAFSERAQPLRAKLITLCEALLA